LPAPCPVRSTTTRIVVFETDNSPQNRERMSDETDATLPTLALGECRGAPSAPNSNRKGPS
jgi:hypothetical protein